MSSTRSSSVVGGWLVAVTRALSGMGLDVSGILEEAGIGVESAHNPEARFTSSDTRKLWRIAKQETKRSDIGLEVARYVCPTTFHALGFSLWASNSLLEALERMVRYADLLNDGASLSLQFSNGQVRFYMDVQQDELGADQVASEGIDYFLGATIKLFRDMSSPNFSPAAVLMEREKPSDTAPYLDFFGSDVEFGQLRNCLVFSREELIEKLPTANIELQRENDKIVSEYLERHIKSDLVSAVRSKLMELLPLGGVTQENVASALGMSGRTLQYRLQQQGSSYLELLNQTRQDLAVDYLKHSKTSITEIAYLLGFSDPSHFNRAFKRWTGLAPSVYRNM